MHDSIKTRTPLALSFVLALMPAKLRTKVAQALMRHLSWRALDLRSRGIRTDGANGQAMLDKAEHKLRVARQLRAQFLPAQGLVR